MYRTLLLFLVVFLCFWRTSFADDPYDLDITLYKSRYAPVHIGGAGKEALLRVRFDSNYIALYTNLGLTPASGGHTYDAIDSTELLFFVDYAHALRLPVIYTYSGNTDPRAPDPEDTAERVTHHGVLGLGPQSPLWQWFDAMTLTRTHLLLGRAVDGRSGDNRSTDILISLAHDYTWVSDPSLYYDMYAESTSGGGGGLLLNVTSDGQIAAWVHPLGLDSTDSAMDLVLFNSSLPYRAQVGLEHVRSLVISDVISDNGQPPPRVVAAVSGPLAANAFQLRTQYLWALMGAILLFIIWHPGLSHRVLRVSKTWPAARAARLQQEEWAFVAYGSTVCVLCGVYAAALCLESWRQLHELASPYGEASFVLDDIVYWTLVAYALFIPLVDTALDTHRPLTFARVYYRAISLYIVCWLFVLVQFDEGINMLLMLLFSGLIFLRHSDLFILQLYSDASSTASVGLHFLLLLASAWFFAFYQVAAYIEERWPRHPSAWLIELLVLCAVWYLFSFNAYLFERASFFLALSKAHAKQSPLQPPASAYAPMPPPQVVRNNYYTFAPDTGAMTPMSVINQTSST